MTDKATEASVAARRANQRQRMDPPLLIRDDGVLYPNTALTAIKPRYRPYYGDPAASLDDRMRFLQGLGAKRSVTFTSPEPFDVGQADKDALIQFALEQWGEALDGTKSVDKLREEVYKLSQPKDTPDTLTESQREREAAKRERPPERETKAHQTARNLSGAEVTAGDYARRMTQERAAASPTAVRPAKTVTLPPRHEPHKG